MTGDSVEQVVLEVDPEPVVQGTAKANAALDSYGKKAVAINDAAGKAFENQGNLVVRTSDRTRSSVERLVASAEKLNATYGKSNVEQLIAKRDQLILRLNGEESAINRVRAAYAGMIAAETASAGAGISETKATAAAVKGLEGNLLNSNRAASAFLVNILGMGPLLKVAFPVFGALAFIGVLVAMTTAAYKFYKSIVDLPKQIDSAFHELTLKQVSANDELRLTNQNLDNQIAKLEHRPQNLLAEALDQARVNADKLSQSLRTDLDDLVKLLKANELGSFKALFTLSQDTVNVTEGAEKFRTKIVNIDNDAALNTEMAGKDPTRLQQVLDNHRAQRREAFAQELADLKQQIADRSALQQRHESWTFGAGYIRPSNQATELQALRGRQAATLYMQDTDQLTEGKDTKEAKLKNAQVDEAASNVTKGLREDLARAQEGELNGLGKINAARVAKLAQLREEGRLTATNASLVNQRFDTDTAHFIQESARKVATTQLDLARATDAAAARNQASIDAAARKSSGSQYGESDIKREYDEQVAASNKMHDLEMIHVHELEVAHRDLADIVVAYQTAQEHQLEAAGKAEAERIVKLLELDAERVRMTKEIGLAQLENTRKDADVAASEQQKNQHDALAWQIKMAELGGGKTTGDQLNTAATVEELRISGAIRQYGQASARLDQEKSDTTAALNAETDDKRRLELSNKLREINREGIQSNGDLQREIDDAHRDRALKTAEIEKQEFEEIAKTSAGLWNTLFTKPKEFGSQLTATLKAALLKPVTEGLGNMTATLLHPAGSPGSNVFKGIFGGGGKGLADVRVTDGAMHVVIDGVSGSASSESAPSSGGGSVPGGGGSFAPGWFSRAARTGMSFPLAAALTFGGGMASPSAVSPAAAQQYETGGAITYAGAPTQRLSNVVSTFASPASFDGGTLNGRLGEAGGVGSISPTSGFGGFAGIGGWNGSTGGARSGGRGSPIAGVAGRLVGSVFGGGGGGASGGSGGSPLSGFSGLLKNFKGNLGGFTRGDAGGTPGVDGQAGTDDGSTGSITGVNGLAGAALTAGGTMLWQQGLLGSSRGTAAGVAEGALGGAMAGFAMGGPLGAAIGGAAGLLAGLGEVIAGVETPERQAARLIKSIYGLNIDSNSTTVAQIVAMSKQSFGSNISVTVRSPQVRQLLQLYADSTGQKSSVLLAQQVHSASLAESGGSLYQQATYNNGTPYTYASNLPTLGPTGGTLPTAAPGGQISVNLNPQQTVDLWQMGTTQAIAGNPRGVAAASVAGSGQSSARLNAANLQFSPSTILS
ncbi:MAG: hypothetical protein WDO73_02740 [Ignavibacteriota bacterium]